MSASSIVGTDAATGTDVTGRLSARVRQVPASGIRKFFDILASMDDVISLGVGEPDFVTPEHILQAGVESLAKGETHYTSNYGLMELREAVAEYLSGHYGVRYDPKTEILLTAGVSEAVDIALRAVIDPGDEVIVPEPAYVSYRPCITFAGGEPVGINSSAETNFRITAGANRRGNHAPHQSAAARLPGEPNRSHAAPRRVAADRRVGTAAQPHHALRRNLRAARVYHGAYVCERPPRSVGPHYLAWRLFQVIRHDRLAYRIRGSAKRGAGIHHEGAPVRGYVRAHHEPVCGLASRSAR